LNKNSFGLSRGGSFSLSSQVVVNKDENQNADDYEEKGDQPCCKIEQRRYVQKPLFKTYPEYQKRQTEHIIRTSLAVSA